MKIFAGKAFAGKKGFLPAKIFAVLIPSTDALRYSNQLKNLERGERVIFYIIFRLFVDQGEASHISQGSDAIRSYKTNKKKSALIQSDTLDVFTIQKF